MLYRKQLTKEQALQKVRHYCAYQDRCEQEVKEKLYSLGLRKAAVEESLLQLIDENYVNEKNFAAQFANGKFKIKQWGRVKIRHELKQKNIRVEYIENALQQIDRAEYQLVLTQQARKKWETFKGAAMNTVTKKAKTTHYLVGKGYEANLVGAVLKDLNEKKSSE